MHEIQNLLIELDKLKSIYRASYISDGSRKENSAEHSWHLAIALLALKDILPDELNLDHAIRMALVHDVCEIGAGDVSVYDANRSQMKAKESAFINEFATQFDNFGEEVSSFWHEYEDQKSLESTWVKVVDRLLPFLLNMVTDGQNWRDHNVAKSQVLAVNKPIFETSPELGNWLMSEIEIAVQKGWIKEG